MKYCEDCGYECADDAKFCGLCGFAFGEMIVETKETENVEKSAEAERIENAENAAEADVIEETEKSAKTEADEPVEDEDAVEAEEVKEPVEAEEETSEAEKSEKETAEADKSKEVAVGAEESKEPAEPDTKEYYKQQMLQNKQMIDDLMEQQRQMQLQMQTMQQQQWKQTQQQQRHQKMINHYNYQVSQQQQAQAQSKGIPIRNMWSLIAAVICLFPFFVGDFVRFNRYYSASYGFIEFCGEMVDRITYGSTDSFSAWVTSVLPLFVIALVIVLIIGGYKAVHSARGWLVVANIIAIIVAFFHIKCESLDGVSLGISFWILVVGIIMATYSCWTDNPEVTSQPRTLSYDDIQGPAYSLSLLAAESSLELKQEWRCPKCDSKNPIDYKYCKTCSTARS